MESYCLTDDKGNEKIVLTMTSDECNALCDAVEIAKKYELMIELIKAFLELGEDDRRRVEKAVGIGD